LPLCTYALEHAQVDQHIDQRVEVSDRGAIAKLGALDAEVSRQGVDPFGGGALPVEVLVGSTVPIQLMTDACADAGGQGGLAAALGSVGIINGTGLAGRFRKEQRADVTALFVWDKDAFARPKGELAGHGEPSFAQR